MQRMILQKQGTVVYLDFRMQNRLTKSSCPLQNTGCKDHLCSLSCRIRKGSLRQFITATAVIHHRSDNALKHIFNIYSADFMIRYRAVILPDRIDKSCPQRISLTVNRAEIQQAETLLSGIFRHHLHAGIRF